MIDAFRHDYVTAGDAPFLCQLAAGNAHGSLQPSFGFEPDGAYFSGLDPEECDGGAQYWMNPDERVFYLTRLFSFLDKSQSEWVIRNARKVLRLVAQLAARDPLTRRLAPTNRIPIRLLERFSFPMRKFACERGFMPSPTIFDVVRQQGGRFHFHGHPMYSVKARAVSSRYLKEDTGSNDMAFLFIGDLDGIGHRHGPDSEERRISLRQVDNEIRRIHDHARKHYKEVNLLVFGDHGMVTVRHHVDLTGTISQAGLKPENDTYFLDSTFARFWIADEERKQRLCDLLAATDGGHVLDPAERERYRIRYPHNYFGDIIFAVDDAHLIHPSFYASDGAPPRGMHGYLPGCRDNESAFVLAAPAAENRGDMGRIDMRRIFPTVLHLLGYEETFRPPHGLTSIV